VLSADAEGVVLDVEGAHRRFGYAKLGPGAIQVEFGRLQTEQPEPERAERPEQQPEARHGH
jgi:hypothetical protein